MPQKMSEHVNDGVDGDVDGSQKNEFIIRKVQLASHQIGPVCSLEMLDEKVLRFQNRKLAQCVARHKCGEIQLHHQVMQLAQRQKEDLAIWKALNRHWKQLNKGIRTLLASLLESIEKGNNANIPTTSDYRYELPERVPYSKFALFEIVRMGFRIVQGKARILNSPTIANMKCVAKQPYTAATAEYLELQGLNSLLHADYRAMSLMLKQQKYAFTSIFAKNLQLWKQVVMLRHEMEHEILRKNRLENQLAEKEQELRMIEGETESATVQLGIQDLEIELQQIKDLADERLELVNILHGNYREKLWEREKLKYKMCHLSDSNIMETPEYRSLQIYYFLLDKETRDSVVMLSEVHKEYYKLYNPLTEARREEQLASEIFDTETSIMHIRQHFVAARHVLEDQMIIIENRTVILSYMNVLLKTTFWFNRRLMHEVKWCRSKQQFLCARNKKLREKIEEAEQEIELSKQQLDSDKPVVPKCPKPQKVEIDFETVPAGAYGIAVAHEAIKTTIKNNCKSRAEQIAEYGWVGDVKIQLKKTLTETAEIELLVHTYKTNVTEEQREKAQHMFSGAKLRLQFARMQQKKEAAARRPRSLITRDKLRKMLADLELTKNAYQDLQKRNFVVIGRLLDQEQFNMQQMAECRNANFLNELYIQEAQMLEQLIGTREKLCEFQTILECVLLAAEWEFMNALSNWDKWITYQKALRAYIREVERREQEASIFNDDIKLQIEINESELRKAETLRAEESVALEAERYKTKRLEEEQAILKLRIESLDRENSNGGPMELLLRQKQKYVRKLTCPACMVNPRDTVLTRCCHVFCYNCLHTRYQQCNRKCPQCNRAFGIKNYRQIYLT